MKLRNGNTRLESTDQRRRSPWTSPAGYQHAPRVPGRLYREPRRLRRRVRVTILILGGIACCAAIALLLLP